jgi:hypothetical protein
MVLGGLLVGGPQFLIPLGCRRQAQVDEMSHEVPAGTRRPCLAAGGVGSPNWSESVRTSDGDVTGVRGPLEWVLRCPSLMGGGPEEGGVN